MPPQRERAEKLFPFLARIEAADWAAAGLINATMAAGDPAFVEGEACPFAAFVLSGAIRVYKAAEDGRELTLYYVLPGDSCVLMWSSLLAGGTYPAQAAADRESDVLLLPAPVFNVWLERYGDVRRFVYETLLQRLAGVMMLVEEVLFRQVDERLARLLLQNLARPGHMWVTTHERLALELGTAREVVSRILKTFEAAGALRLFRGRIELLDRQILADLGRP